MMRYEMLTLVITEPRTKTWKKEKLKSKMDMLRSIGKQSEESVESVLYDCMLQWQRGIVTASLGVSTKLVYIELD